MEEEKQKYILIDMHGLDKWSMNHDDLVGREFTICNGHELQRSMFGFEFVKGWFHLENPPEDTETQLPRDGNYFFIGARFQTIEDNQKENGILVVVP